MGGGGGAHKVQQLDQLRLLPGFGGVGGCKDRSLKVDLTIIDVNIAVFSDAKPTTGGQGSLADRWSCGRVLKHFTKLMEPSLLSERLCKLSQQLTTTSNTGQA